MCLDPSISTDSNVTRPALITSGALLHFSEDAGGKRQGGIDIG